MLIEGVDYSSTSHDNWAGLAEALKEAGMHFAGRYAVYDKSPGGRGITAEEYQALVTAGLDVFLYYEEDTAWMTNGWSAGVRAATRALDNIQKARMPQGMPVMYSHDIDPEPQHFEAIDECLRGAASVVGIERVGFYGGWLGIDHVHAAGTAKWFVQTIAWQYQHGIHPAAHLHQYNTGTNIIGGANCDLVAALKPHYGQASDFLLHPTTTTTLPPLPPRRTPAPDFISAQGHPLSTNKPTRFLCIQGGRFKTSPNLKADTTPPIIYRANTPYTFPYSAVVDGEIWLVSKFGSWAPAKNFRHLD